MCPGRCVILSFLCRVLRQKALIRSLSPWELPPAVFSPEAVPLPGASLPPGAASAACRSSPPPVHPFLPSVQPPAFWISSVPEFSSGGWSC